MPVYNIKPQDVKGGSGGSELHLYSYSIQIQSSEGDWDFTLLNVLSSVVLTTDNIDLKNLIKVGTLAINDYYPPTDSGIYYVSNIDDDNYDIIGTNASLKFTETNVIKIELERQIF